LRRRLQTLTGEFDKKSASFDAGIVPKTGTTLVRQWHGHAHAVLDTDQSARSLGQAKEARARPMRPGDPFGDHGQRAIMPALIVEPVLAKRKRTMRRSARSGARRYERVRCAIYTRKSSEEGLEQEFNSLQAQREACEAFINSQRHEGWVCLPKAYDDGGFSGATIDRPALRQLLSDIAAIRTGVVLTVGPRLRSR
jgi:hypothetical protein